MIRRPVVSSDIHSIGYEADSHTLEIEFHSGGIYQYYSVPQPVYDGLMNAPSHGKYFQAHIKGVFQYRRIR
jgi:hypothetical protein